MSPAKEAAAASKSALVALGLLPIAYLVRKLDTMPLIFAFLVHDRMIDAGNRLISLYW